MPTLIPELITVDAVAAGDACSVCWGAGKPFGDGDTPESIVLNFSGINKGPSWSTGDPEPLSGEIELPQNPSVPCNFSDLIGTVGYEFTFLAGTTALSVDDGGTDLFVALVVGACSITLFNELTTMFVGGTCQVFIPEVL